MSTIVGGMGIAHTPSMGFAYDKGIEGKFAPEWAPWFDGTRPVKRWIEAIQPTMAVIIYNDHMNYFDLSIYPTFGIGVGSEFPQADEGFGLRPFPTFEGDPDFAWTIARSAVEQGFDLTYCHELELDHGVYAWAPYVLRNPWPIRILPIAVNTLLQPIPTRERLWDLGLTLKSAIEDDGRDERILFISTGGMSHQIHGQRFGQANSKFDRYFLDRLGEHPDELMKIPMDTLMKIAGTEAGELGMWFSMRAAVGENRRIYSYYTLPAITGCGVLCLEPERES